MNIKKFAAVFMCIAIVFAALPVASYAQDDVPTAEPKQSEGFINFDVLKEKAEDGFELTSFLGYWGIYFGLAAIIGTLSLPISPILVIYHQINKAISDKKNVVS